MSAKLHFNFDKVISESLAVTKMFYLVSLFQFPQQGFRIFNKNLKIMKILTYHCFIMKSHEFEFVLNGIR